MILGQRNSQLHLSRQPYGPPTSDRMYCRFYLVSLLSLLSDAYSIIIIWYDAEFQCMLSGWLVANSIMQPAQKMTKRIRNQKISAKQIQTGWRLVDRHFQCQWNKSYAMVTCEIKLFQNYFGLRRRLSEKNLFQCVETCLKLFQNYLTGTLQLTNIFQHVHCYSC